MKWTLFAKIFVAMLLVSLLPLLLLAFFLGTGISSTADQLASQLAAAINMQVGRSLEHQAREVAEDVGKFLRDCEADLLLAVALADSPESLTRFYEVRREEVWHRSGTPDDLREIKEKIPRYASLEVTDRQGRQTFAIRYGRRIPEGELRSIADPAATDFRSEEYFRRAARLKRGEIYVSHVTGFHVGKKEQLGDESDPERAVGGAEFRGVVRFATPRFDSRGRFAGIVALGLDHRHLMEFTQHILPGHVAPTVFPSYKSGNYAFMFDDEGWIITHPKYWDIRGLDRQGRLIPPYSIRSSKSDVEAGRIPYNLDHAGFIHPNYPVVAAQVRAGRSGFVDVTNVGGAKKVMAFAPIVYSTGDYRRYGIFGAVTIGFQTDQFQGPARVGVALVRNSLREQLHASILIIALAAVLVPVCALLISRGITRPLALLTIQAHDLALGESTRQVEVSGNDEVRALADSFNRMASELELRKRGLLNTLDQLQASKAQITAEKNFKASILESISSAILTFSPDGLLSSINGTGRSLFGDRWKEGDPARGIFSATPPLGDHLAQVLAGERPFGRESLEVVRDGETRHYDVGYFPIAEEAGGGITLTIRDETEREHLREEMMRLDRLASLGRLSAGIAHEVRNPLTGISLLLDDLHDRMAEQPENAGLIARALAEIDRVERLISSLLSYAAPPASRFRVGDLSAVVQDVLLLFRKACAHQGIELSCQEGLLPSFSFDPEKLRQLLINLLKNAQEALPDGGAIRIVTAREGDMAVISVWDSGCGIPAEDLPHLFEPFFSRKGAGTGLGLSIVQRIVEEHGGEIEVESAGGSGTTFTVRLPLTAAASDMGDE
uniref:histidine kinase n=1 Tax=Geobacter metallireducens TaxID=28232 RepID=A0A831UDM5_GEOME